MEATITTLQDVFKNQVKDSVKVPTIWADPNTGEEYTDFKYAYIANRDAMDETMYCDPDLPYQIKQESSTGPDVLFANGPIKQVGSHVKFCGALYDTEKSYRFPIRDIFKYAYSLESVDSLFCFLDKIEDFVVPEDLFWNCPKLTDIFNSFSGTNLKQIPPRLFERCPNLESIFSAFSSTKITEIPENLFKNNPKITGLDAAFTGTKVQKIPDKLLEQFKDRIISGDISVFDFIEDTPIKDAIIYGKDKPQTPEEDELLRSKYLPMYLPKEIQYRMMGSRVTEN